jgi:hypothetical protein
MWHPRKTNVRKDYHDHRPNSRKLSGGERAIAAQDDFDLIIVGQPSTGQETLARPR